MSITTLDGALAGMKPPVPFWKKSQTGEGAGTTYSLFTDAGNPGAGSNPPEYTAGSGYECSKDTPGALPYVNPVSGNSYLARFTGVISSAGLLILYDRLWACKGFTTNHSDTLSVTTPGTIPSRDANGAALGHGCEIWGEVYTAPGATGATWTVAYKDQDNNDGSATYTHPANAESVGQMFPFIFASGDNGVRQIVSFTPSTTSGTAGDIGITVMRRIAELPLTIGNSGTMLSLMTSGMPRLYDGSCLALAIVCSASATGALIGSLVYTQG